jgi:hypothetical protein
MSHMSSVVVVFVLFSLIAICAICMAVSMLWDSRGRERENESGQNEKSPQGGLRDDRASQGAG